MINGIKPHISEENIRDERIRNNTPYEFGENVLVVGEELDELRNILKETMKNGKLGKKKRGWNNYIDRLMRVLDYRDGKILIGKWSDKDFKPHPFYPSIELDNDLEYIDDVNSKYHIDNTPKLWFVYRGGVWVDKCDLRKEESLENIQLQIKDRQNNIEMLKDRIEEMENEIEEEKVESLKLTKEMINDYSDEIEKRMKNEVVK